MARARRAAPRRGMVAVLVALALLPLMAAVALLIEGGILQARRRHVQAGADAAAHAAACVLAKNYATDAGLDPQSKARSAAQAVAALNGYNNDNTTSTVAINIPPGSGPFSGRAGNAEVAITHRQPRTFGALFGSGVIPITARAVGRVVSNAPPSILLTDPSAAGALTLTGGARLTASGLIQVNSSHAWAVDASNGAYATDNGGMSIVGGYRIPSWATPSTFFSRSPLTTQASAPDPYASVPAPAWSGLPARGAPNPPYGSATLEPGLYQGGLTLGGGMTITMNPGLYYFKGGNFTVANGVRLSGSGVTLFFDTGAVNFQGGTTITLSAPTSGTYKAIVLFQDRANTTSLNNIANGATVNMTGALYAPQAPLTIAGGAWGASYGTQFIVRSLNLSNGVNVSINTPSSAGTLSAPFLAE